MTTIEINHDIIESDIISLHDNDFNSFSLDTFPEKDMVVMFYKNKSLLDLWSAISEQVVGVKFGICNVMIEKNISLSLSTLQDVLPSCGTVTYPLILTYKEGCPISFYNDKFNMDLIINYSLGVSEHDYSDILLTGVRMARPTRQVVSQVKKSEKLIKNYVPMRLHR